MEGFGDWRKNFTNCKEYWQVQYLNLYQKPSPALGKTRLNNRVR